MQRHPYQQTSDEWRVPSLSRNMGCCSAQMFQTAVLLDSVRSFNEEDYNRRQEVLERKVPAADAVAASMGSVSNLLGRMAEDCNNALITSEDYAGWRDTVRSATSVEDARTKARGVIAEMLVKTRDSALQGNCR